MNRLPTRGIGLALAMAFPLLAACSGQQEPSSSTDGENDEYVIATGLIAPVDVLEDEVAAFKEELAARGLVEGENVTYVDTNAQGQVSNVELAVTRMLEKDPDLVFAIGTPLNVSLAQKDTTTPLIFGAMTDPMDAKVVESLDTPGANSTGASDAVPGTFTLDTVKEVVPDVATIGVIGNPSEQNTQSFITELESAAADAGVTVQTAPITNTNDATVAARSLAGGADAIVIPADNTAVNALASISQVANDAGVPTFMAAGPEFANQGVTVAFGIDYAEFGVKCAEYAAQILLDGADPADLPVIGLETGTAELAIAVNQESVDALGLTVPSEWTGP